MGAENWKRQLELAIAWNRVDIAKTEIFTEESQWRVGQKAPGALCPLIIVVLSIIITIVK